MISNVLCSSQFAADGNNQHKAQLKSNINISSFNMMRFLLLPLIVGVATSKSIRASSTSDGDRVLQANELSGIIQLIVSLD